VAVLIVGPVENVRIREISRTSLSLSFTRDSVGRISFRTFERKRSLTVESRVLSEDELSKVLEPLEELALKNPQVRVIANEYNGHLNGFYVLQRVERDPIVGTSFVESFTFELIYIGNKNSHSDGFHVSQLGSVENDWGI